MKQVKLECSTIDFEIYNMTLCLAVMCTIPSLAKLNRTVSFPTSATVAPYVSNRWEEWARLFRPAPLHVTPFSQIHFRNP